MTNDAAVFRTADGTGIAYSDHGAGPSVVLLHGMACDRSHVEPVARHLADRFRCVAVDMRGNGASDQPHGDYSIARLGEDVVELCEHLGLDRPVVVGHSLGGSVALDVAVRRRGWASAIVMIDSGVRPLSAFSQELAPFYAKIGGPDHAETVRSWLADRVFEPSDPEELVDAVLELMTSTSPHAFVGMAKGISEFDSFKAATSCTVPALLILAARPFADPACVSQLPANWSVGRTVGAGHFNQLVVPEQVLPMIDRFLQLSTVRPAPVAS